jgi:peptidoglycan hydrolase-like protein with peptidoglycan-binding domain
MRRSIARPALLIAAVSLVAAACGGESSSDTTSTTLAVDSSTTTSTTRPVVTETTATSTTESTSSTTTTTQPTDPPLAVQGDRNETVEAFQYLINCNGFADLTVDGAFGPATQAAVEATQVNLGQPVTGTATEGMLEELSRSCAQLRRIEGEGEIVLVGNAAPDDPEQFSAALLSGSSIVVSATPTAFVEAVLLAPGGEELPPEDGATWEIGATQDYVLEVRAEEQATTFTLTVEIAEAVQETGDWILATDGITYKGTELGIGDDAQTVIDRVIDFLGHGVRGPYDEFDTGWYAITDPADMGLRGLFIEGLAFLFFGPDPTNLDRPETLQRVRFEGPSDDAAGNPRPDNYVTTAEGITVGDTLADLKAAYGSSVAAGSNADEHYYRYAAGGGELCFYFGSDAPDDFDPIVEMATECRG